MTKQIITFLLTIILTLILLMIPNKSNINELILIPIIVSLLIKYVLGDWDNNYMWSYTDILYWVSILAISLITIYGYNFISTLI